MAANPLTTWAQIQTRLEMQASQEAEATALIPIASERAERFVGRVLGAATITRQFDGSGSERLILAEWPINSVTSVHVDQELEFGSETEVTDYKILSDLGQLYRDVCWPEGVQNVRVVGNVGYSEVPADLEESIVQLVGYWMQSPQLSYFGSLAGDDGAPRGSQFVGTLDVPFQVRNVWDQYVY